MQQLENKQVEQYREAWLKSQGRSGHHEIGRQQSMHHIPNIHQELKHRHLYGLGSPGGGSIGGLQKSTSLRGALPPSLDLGIANRASQHIPGVGAIHKGVTGHGHVLQQIRNGTQSARTIYGVGSPSVNMKSTPSSKKKEKKHKKRSKSRQRKQEEAARLALVYDSEYTAMKRRYQQRKRKRMQNRANTMRSTANGAVPANGYNKHQGDAAMYDSDFSRADSEQIVPL